MFGVEEEPILSKKDDWLNYGDGLLPSLSGDTNFYTDGSLVEDLAGAGVYCPELQVSRTFCLGQNVTVFQAEVYAIIVALQICRQREMEQRNISIFSDSQAAIKALFRPEVNSRLVLECEIAYTAVRHANSITHWS